MVRRKSSAALWTSSRRPLGDVARHPEQPDDVTGVVAVRHLPGEPDALRPVRQRHDLLHLLGRAAVHDPAVVRHHPPRRFRIVEELRVRLPEHLVERLPDEGERGRIRVADPAVPVLGEHDVRGRVADGLEQRRPLPHPLLGAPLPFANEVLEPLVRVAELRVQRLELLRPAEDVGFHLAGVRPQRVGDRLLLRAVLALTDDSGRGIECFWTAMASGAPVASTRSKDARAGLPVLAGSSGSSGKTSKMPRPMMSRDVFVARR
jgi:hypothetical protein